MTQVQGVSVRANMTDSMDLVRELRPHWCLVARSTGDLGSGDGVFCEADLLPVDSTGAHVEVVKRFARKNAARSRVKTRRRLVQVQSGVHGRGKRLLILD
jgi:hypothetical protein